MKTYVSYFDPMTIEETNFIRNNFSDDDSLLIVNNTIEKNEFYLYQKALKNELELDITISQISTAELATLPNNETIVMNRRVVNDLHLTHDSVFEVEEQWGYELLPFSKHHIFDHISESLAEYIIKNLMFGLSRQIELVFEAMSYNRFKHTMRVVYRMNELVSIYDDLDPLPSYYAALFHDYAKKLPIEQQAQYVSQYFPTFIDAPTAAYHGFVAAVELQLMDDTLDGDVYEAIAYHTLGIPNYCLTGMALMIADYCDFKRPFTDTWMPVWDSATNISIPQGALEKLQAITKYLHAQGKDVYHTTQDMLDWLTKQLDEERKR